MKTASTLLLSALAAASSSAAIVYSGPQNLTISSTFDSLFLDVDGGVSGGSPTVGWDIEAFFGGEGFGNSENFQPVRQTVAVDSAIVRLEIGDIVDGSGIYAATFAGSDSHIGPGAGQFQSGVTGYLGFRMYTNDAEGPYYGWMRVNLSNTGENGTIIDWAYENTGASITVGAVPEPSALVFTMLSAGVVASRRSRARR